MRAGWLWLLALGACVKAGDVPCGDRVCPSNTVCESVTMTCITREQETVCNEEPRIEDGETCTGFGFVGICQDRKCLPGCGDGALNRAVETCDDGNFRSHDGCSSSCLAETLSWEQMADPWSGMFDHAAGFFPSGSASGYTVLVTGQSESGLRTEQFVALQDATAWISYSAEEATFPSPRTGAAMAYDPTRNKLVLFGGRAAGYLDDTWEWDIANGWVQVTNLTNRPPPREGGEVAYHTANQRLVLFGGINSTGHLADTWEYNGTWMQRTPATRPEARVKHAMAYDASCACVMLYGGSVFGPVSLSDHWEYDNGVWTLVSTGGAPGKRSGAAMGYDASRNVVLFGGLTDGPGGPAFANDTWQYNGSSWTQVVSTYSPPARSGATLTPAQTVPMGNPPLQLVLIGGEQTGGKPPLADAWRLTPSGWVDISPRRLPPARQGAPAVYDDREHNIHVFGGLGTSIHKDHWTFEESRWDSRKAGESFVPHYLHAASYDPIRDRIVMFGGIKDSTRTTTNDTFEIDSMPSTSSWAEVTPTQSPSPRTGGVLAWNGSTLVLFGGTVSDAPTDETWTYNGVTWAQDTKMGPWPKASSQAAAAYDRIHDRLVLFDRDGVTWTYANHAWTQLVAASDNTPPPRDAASMTFNWQTRRMVLTGGQDEPTELLTDVWELDDTTWRKLDVFGASPLPRALFGFSSTPLGNKTVLVGGTPTGGQASGDAWTLRYKAAGTPDEDCHNSKDDDGDLRVNDRDPDCCARNEPNNCLEGP